MAVMGEAEGCGQLALALIMQKARAPAKEVGSQACTFKCLPCDDVKYSHWCNVCLYMSSCTSRGIG